MRTGAPTDRRPRARVAAAVRMVLRVAVSALLIVWLLRQVDLRATLQLLGQVRWSWLAAAIGAVVGVHLTNCWRWRWCLPDGGRGMSFQALVVSYWTSLFVGLALPTEYGGDVLRVKDAWNRTTSGSAALASVLWSRLSGIAATFLVFAFAGLGHLDRLVERSWVWLWVASGVISLTLVVLLLVRPARAAAIAGLGRLPGSAKPLELLGAVGRVDRGVAWRVAALALVAQAGMIVTNALYAAALGQPVGIFEMALVVPLVTLSSLLPISLAGLGVKEGAFVVGLSIFGLSAEGALSIALLNRLVLLALALSGGLLFPFRGELLRDPDRPSM